MLELNGWTEEITQTAIRWRTVGDKLMLSYDDKADSLRTRINVVKKILLVIGAVSTIMSILNISTDAISYKIILIVTTVLAECTTGYMTIETLTEDFEIYTRYNEKLRLFLGNIASEISIPVQHRMEGVMFIDKYKNKFQELLTEKPNIRGKDLLYTDLDRKLHLDNLHRNVPNFYCTDDNSDDDILITKTRALPNPDHVILPSVIEAEL